jgi:hypothetical protein
VFKRRVLRKIFGPNRDRLTGDWRKLYNEELHDLYSPPLIVLVMKSRKMWHEWGRMVLVGSLKERDHLEDVGVGGII